MPRNIPVYTFKNTVASSEHEPLILSIALANEYFVMIFSIYS